MSLSARFAPARTVRRDHKRAYAQYVAPRWVIYAHPMSAAIIGRGSTRVMAWRNAAFRIK